MRNQALRLMSVMPAIFNYAGDIARANELRQPVMDEFLVRHDVSVVCALRECRGVCRESTRFEQSDGIFRVTNSSYCGKKGIFPLQKYLALRPPQLIRRRAVLDESEYVHAHDSL